MREGEVSSGIEYIDQLLGYLRIGDNIVWEAEAGTYVDIFLDRFMEYTLREGERVVYVSFNRSPATVSKRFRMLPNKKNLTILDCFTAGKGNNDSTFTRFYDNTRKELKEQVVKVDNPRDTVQFREAINKIETKKREGTRYLFDSLTGMQDLWGDEEKTFKFFTYSCPQLYDLNTIAYWVLESKAHSSTFKANLRHITQVVLELGKEDDNLFIRVAKAEGRSSRDFFNPKKFEVWGGEIFFPSIRKREVVDLGNKIKMLRLRQGFTQKELAEKVGLTPSFISQLEGNLISPSIATLLSISAELKVNPVYFFPGEDALSGDKIVVRKNERESLKLPELTSNQVRYQLLSSNTSARKMEPHLIAISSGSEIRGHLYSHKGEEFAFILKGKLEMEVQGRKHILKEGDAIYLESAVPSRWINIGDSEAEMVWVLSPPRR